VYKAFKNEIIKEELVRRAKQENKKFVFIDIISISQVTGDNYKKFAFENIKLTDIQDKAYYFKRLWTIYFWNSIMLESEKQLGYVSTFSEEVKQITVFEETNQRFKKIIENTELFLKVEQDLKNLDNYLKSKDIHLIILFDQLDKDVHPNLWREIVSPLVKYWERNPFNSIIPKIFVRTDLFGRLELNNKLNIEKNYMVSIEWGREELYSYFFKLILVKSKDEFLNIINGLGVDKNYLTKFINDAIKDNNQIPLRRNLLEPLVTITFGEEIIAKRSQFGHLWARKGKSYGHPYEYLFSNFKNANDTISIRPFINLMSYSIEAAIKNNERKIKDDFLYKNSLPLIDSDFYLKEEYRESAVSEHFNDLVTEGNDELKLIIDFLRDKTEYRLFYLTATELQDLLNGTIETYRELSGKNWKELKELLEANGIINEVAKPDGYIYYFAKLYIFWLALKPRHYQYGTTQRSLYTGSNFEKIEAHFKNKLKVDGIYQQSLIGTMIYEATKSNWPQIFSYPNYDSLLESLQEKGIIELKEQNKFKLIKAINLKVINEL
jgi:hypothetical protein